MPPSKPLGSANIETAQAFPIHKDTLVLSTATNDSFSEMILVHAVASGTITFIFSTGNKVIAAAAGEDYRIGETCTGITSTASVLIS